MMSDLEINQKKIDEEREALLKKLLVERFGDTAKNIQVNLEPSR